MAHELKLQIKTEEFQENHEINDKVVAINIINK